MAVKGKILRKGSFKTRVENDERCQQPDQDQSMMMEKSWVMMHQTDEEHEEQEEACSISEVQHAEKSGL